jgi:putative membrane protein
MDGRETFSVDRVLLLAGSVVAMMGAAMGWMWVWPLLIVVGLVILGYVGVRLVQGRKMSGPSGPDAGAGSSARRILDERYARGEIDEEEYRRRRDVLR